MKKWKWKNGRLHHPTEKMSLSTSEAFQAQEKNDDIAEACLGVIMTYDSDVESQHKSVISASAADLIEYNKRKLEGKTDGK